MKQSTIEQHRRATRSEWPFFAFVTLVMAIIYGTVVLQAPDLRSVPAKFLFFTILMVVYTALYWEVWFNSFSNRPRITS